MAKINRKFFFDYVRLHLFGGSLTQSQVSGLTAILDYWENSYSGKDDRWLAYMFATAHHETDRKFQAIEEYGKGKGKKYAPRYYGRGLVQLTWDYNYKKMGQVFKVDLLNHPELALNLDLAVKIMFYGMMNGSFTGKKLSDYFAAGKEDWVNARRIINGLDKANLIASYGKQYYAAIGYA
ncbi:MAG: glycoside hydrolase family 19 protein [Pyrinomonadaceae bacterium]